MSIWAEVWQPPQIGTFERKIALLPFHSLSYTRGINEFGHGRVQVADGFDRVNELIDPVNDVHTLVRVFDDGVNVHSFFITNNQYEYGVGGAYSLDGPGIEQVLDWGIVYPKDAIDPLPTGFKSTGPDWLYGADTTELITNGGFESSDGLSNFDGGGLDGWAATVRERSILASTSVEVVDHDARSGSNCVEIVPTLNHSGAFKDFDVEPGKRYQFQVWIKCPTGKRATIQATIDTDAVSHQTNWHHYNGFSIVENDGLPIGTGSTDDTYQSYFLDITFGATQTSTRFYVQYDYHDGLTGPPFYFDDFSIAGDGIGIAPWIVLYQAAGYLEVFKQQFSEAWEGDAALQFKTVAGTPILKGGFIQDLVNTQEGDEVAASARVMHDGGGNENITIQLGNRNGTWWANTSNSVPPGVWTTISCQGLRGSGTPYVGIRYGSAGASPNIYVDKVQVYPGKLPATVGVIATALITAIKARGTLTFLKTDSWSDTLDSAGTTWSEQISVSITAGQSLSQVLDRLADMGYEWRVEWNAGASSYELLLFDIISMGDTLTTESIQPSRGLLRATVQRGIPFSTVGLGEGDEQVFQERVDGTLLGAYGRMERYVGNADYRSGETIDLVLQRELLASSENRYSIKADLDGERYSFGPGKTFDIGDIVPVNLPPDVPKGNYRIVNYSTSVASPDNQIIHTVDFGKSFFLVGAPNTRPSRTATPDFQIGRRNGDDPRLRFKSKRDGVSR